MTAVAERPAHRSPHTAAPAVGTLSARLLRRGAVLAPILVAAYMAAEIYSYQRNYPDQAARERLAAVSDSDALRVLQGVPHAVQTTGGFVVWDGGWVLGLGLGVWALLATTRLLRGEEDTGRAELVLAAPVRAGRALVTQLLVLAGAFALAGAGAAAALAVGGTGASSSVLYGLGLAGVTGTVGGLAAVAAQVLPSRRRAVGVAGTALGVLFLLRTAGNSADALAWLRWLTPYGWIDDLHAFGDDRWPVLVPLLAAPVLLGAAAVALRGRRDTGAGLVTGSDRHTGRPWLLGGTPGFTWRSTQGVLIGWTAGVGLYAAVVGALVKTVVDFVAGDPTYGRILADFGLDLTDITEGVVALLGGTLGVVFALYACWRVGAAREEEASGRAEQLLARPLSRRRWLSWHAFLTLVATVLLAVVAGVALWVGAVATGADVGLTDAVGSMLGPLPAVVFLAGLAVLCFGLLPRLTVALSVGLAAATYVIELLGSALGLPTVVLDLSPFHHVAAVPMEPFELLPAAVLAGLGLLAALLGITAFERRDLAGG